MNAADWLMWQDGTVIYVQRLSDGAAFKFPLKPGGWKDRVETEDYGKGRPIRGNTKEQMLKALGVE